jgi:hypothetical protein
MSISRKYQQIQKHRRLFKATNSIVPSGDVNLKDRRVRFYRPSNKKRGGEDMKGKYCIVRTYSAGVFAGIVKSIKGKEAVLTNARRLWYWSGSASLSQMAVDGTKDPKNCKFPVAVPKVLLTEVIEVIPATEEAQKSIESVPVWEK